MPPWCSEKIIIIIKSNNGMFLITAKIYKASRQHKSNILMWQVLKYLWTNTTTVDLFIRTHICCHAAANTLCQKLAQCTCMHADSSHINYTQ